MYIRGDNAYDVDNNDDHNANDDDIADSHNANDDDHPMLMMMNIPYNSDNNHTVNDDCRDAHHNANDNVIAESHKANNDNDNDHNANDADDHNANDDDANDDDDDAGWCWVSWRESPWSSCRAGSTPTRDMTFGR